jgi:predicted nucleotidyltransferase
VNGDFVTSLLGDVLFTKTQQKVLGLLFGKPDETFYLNEIVRLAGIGKGTVSRELDKMQKADLISTFRVGNQNHYQANKDCPIYEELAGIVRKTFGIGDVIKQAMLEYEDEIDYAFVYGSISKGEETTKSDIDLMIVAESIEYADVMNALSDAEKLLARPINPSIYNAKQIKDKLKSKSSFITRIFEQDKIWIKESQDDIKGIR